MGDCKCPFHNCPNAPCTPTTLQYEMLYGDSGLTEQECQSSMDSGICASCIRKYREHPH